MRFKDVVARAPNAATFDPMVSGHGDLPIHDAAKTWEDYQSSRAEAVNSIVFQDYGKYRLEMDAIARATTQCPASFGNSTSGTITAELTLDNLAKANDLVQQHFDFGEQAENDDCSGNNRCDLHQFSKKNFFETKYSRYSHDESISCFDKDLSNGTCYDEVSPVPAGQCTRCCKMSTALREFWMDYRCGSDYDVRYCEGDSDQSCTFEQCVVVNGDTLATITTRIKPGVVTESKQVLHHLHQEDYQTVTQVHRALECTSYYGDDGQCVYMAKLSELIETTQTVNFDEEFNVNDIVYWQLWGTRRKTSAETGCKWSTCDAVYDDDDVLTFSDPETKLSIEEWTQCGLVHWFFFFFTFTRYQRRGHLQTLCDFAELTFDFHPNVGLQYLRTELRMNVSEVVCTGALENRTSVKIFKVTKDFPEIVTGFGVEMLHIPNTEAITNVEVSCDFTHVGYGNAVHKKTCGRSFSIP
ncbi:hypothetical protein F442_21429 [Phytophthora nicotianae P10297]|uniref:Uncharacterized protein n=2 Tax=Phytophthora nicotianae TaxID=4792 RepID=V9DXQ1_PHYNI|nr:hypothetical protein F443_21594 [Phytophthora nicotianae P1569]ETP29416.1 hypothetical protein F442_21429 [Phytophthora nicotianae P10297]